MKLAELTKSYAKAEATTTGSREVIDTVTANVISAGVTESGFPVLELDKPIKVLIEGEFKNVNRVVMFREDLDVFTGRYHDEAKPIYLNGLKAKAQVTVVAYENAEGEANITHRTQILLDDKNEQALMSRIGRNAIGAHHASQSAIKDDRPF